MAGDHGADQVDSATVSIADGAGVAESGTATLTVSVDAAVDVPVTVSWSVVPNADFGAGEVVATTGSVVFPASGATVREALVTLADDSVNEGTETLEVSLTGLTAEDVGDRVALDVTAANGTASVIDDDGLAIGLVGDGAVRRGNVATYTVEFADGVSAGEEVTVTPGHMSVDAEGVGDGVAVVPGPAEDYEVVDPATGMPPGTPDSDVTLVIPAGASGGAVSATVHDTGGTATVDKFFSVSLVAFSGAPGASEIGDPSTVTTTIRAVGGGQRPPAGSIVRLLAVGGTSAEETDTGVFSGIVAFLVCRRCRMRSCASP